MAEEMAQGGQPASGEPVGLQAAVEMLKRELDASKSVSTHLSFLQQIAAGAQVEPRLREQLLAHIGEEEVEHQEHLGRLLPALEALQRRFEGASPAAPKAPPAATARGLTVGSLIANRPWYTRPH